MSCGRRSALQMCYGAPRKLSRDRVTYLRFRLLAIGLPLQLFEQAEALEHRIYLYSKVDEAGDFVDADRFYSLNSFKTCAHSADQPACLRIAIEGMREQRIQILRRQVIQVEPFTQTSEQVFDQPIRAL